LFCWIGCGDDDRLITAAPSLTPDFLEFLAIEDDDAFAAAAIEMGEPRLSTLWGSLVRSTRRGVPGALDAVDPYAARLADIFAEHFNTRLRRIQLANYHRTSREDLARIYEIRQEMYSLNTDAAAPDSVKIARLHAMIDETRTLRADSTAVEILSHLGRVYADFGHTESSRRIFEATLADSRTQDDPWMICQSLGTLAQIHFEAGRIDSAHACLDRAEARAHRSKLATQAARVLMFRAAYARDDGNFGAAYLLTKEARRVCRAFKGGSHEARFFLAEAGLLERLGCWRLCSELMDEAMVVFDIPSYEPITRRTPIRRRLIKLAKASADFELDADFDPDEFGDVLAELSPRPYPEIYAGEVHRYADILRRSSRFAEAETIAFEGLGQSRDDQLDAHAARFELMLARTAWDIGDIALARARLRDHFDHRPRNLLLHADDVAVAAALDIRSTVADTGDGPGLVDTLDRAFADLNEVVSRSVPSMPNYLSLSVFDELRWAVHDLVAHDPALGYAFDMTWRSLARHPDAGGPAEFTAERRPTTAAEYVDAWCRSHDGPGTDADHLLYVVRRDDVLRWHAGDGRIARDVLPTTRTELEKLVDDVAAAVSERPGPPTGARPQNLQIDLERLAHVLLPESLSSSPPERLLISTDDMLELLPFGVLPAGPDHRSPLALCSDMVRLRYSCGDELETEPKRVVIASPQIAPKLRRLHPGLVALPESETEGRKVAAHWTDATLLSGIAATKSAVIAALTHASHVYIAAHIARSARTPFLKFLPLAVDADQPRLEHGMLEMRDILGMDLRSCRLVVLAGCSSGTPYVTGTRLAPGFGDVFLDAGARCAVQNLWLVEDRTMARLMESVIADMGNDDAVWRLAASLRRAKTDLIAESGGDLHPFHWGGLTLVSSDPGR